MEGNNTGVNLPAQPDSTQAAAAGGSAPGATEFARRKRHELVKLLLLSLIWGSLSGLIEPTSDPRLLDLAAGLLFGLVTCRWCEIDCQERDRVRGRFFAPLMVVFPGPLVMTPLHLFNTRGWGGFVATAKAVAIFVLFGLTAALSEVAFSSAAWDRF